MSDKTNAADAVLATLRELNAKEPPPSVADLERRIAVMRDVILGMDAELADLRTRLREAEGIAEANRLIDPSQWSRILQVVRRPPPLAGALAARRRGKLTKAQRAQELRDAGLSVPSIARHMGREDRHAPDPLTGEIMYPEGTVKRWFRESKKARP